MADQLAMHDLLRLNDILKAQDGAYKKMLEIESEKTQVLLDGDTNTLLRLMNAQQAHFMQTKELEKQRSALCNSMDYATLRELVKSSKECEALLGSVYASLGGTISELKKKNALNKKLLETRLVTIRFMAEQLGLENGFTTYGKSIQTKV